MASSEPIRLQAITLHHLKMPLVTPFRTSFGAFSERELLLVEAVDTDGISGWGEVVPFTAPFYTEETLTTAWHILRDFLIPVLLASPLDHPDSVPQRLAHVQRHHMAKAGLEGAVWDLYAKRRNLPLAITWGGERKAIPVGVSIGIQETIHELFRKIEQYLEAGYRRVKLKIEPGRDVEIIRQVRHRYPGLMLMADANGAYTLADLDRLKALDDYELLMIEEPLPAGHLLDHATLQRHLRTPLCLDESISTFEEARLALTLGSCKIVNLKLARVGGYAEARRIHDLCLQQQVPVWCGGMLESGVGRAHNIALAALPGFTLPGDISASKRYWQEDIIEPEVTVDDGQILVPESPGMGYRVALTRFRKYRQASETFRAP